MGDIDDVQTRVHAVLGQASIGFSVLAVGVRVSSIVRVVSVAEWFIQCERKPNKKIQQELPEVRFIVFY